MPLRRSRRPGTSFTRQPRGSCTITSTPPAATRPGRSHVAFRGRLPSVDALSSGASRLQRCPERSAARNGFTHLSMMTLHSGGHRHGVVCAPHHAAVEAGRLVLANGGNAIEAMIAMASTIAAVYPHLSHLGGDGIWPFASRRGACALIWRGPRRSMRAELYREHESILRAAARGAHGPRRRRRLSLALEAARAYGGGCRLQTSWRKQSVMTGGYGEPQPVTIDRGQARRARACAGLPRLSHRRQAAEAVAVEANRARRDARSSRPCRSRRLLSRRYRARDRGRPEQVGSPSRVPTRARPRDARRAALRRTERWPRSTPAARRASPP